MDKPKCILTVDVEAWEMRAPDRPVDTLIYGRINGAEWGIGRMMDIADRHGVKMTFFLDFTEVELYGNEIIEAGKYIAGRGHDLQLHCHHEVLVDKVLKRFPDVERHYAAWRGYENEAISEFIVDYCLAQYYRCGVKGPIVFRGGAYRFGAPLIKKLKEKGIVADASYNYLRPRQLPVNRQFVYENGLLELPVGILPDAPPVQEMLLNFNFEELYPACENDWTRILKRYEELFRAFYWYYGSDAVLSLMMHSWSFCYDKERFRATGYIDRPNPSAAGFFDRFLESFREKVDFITAAQAVQSRELFTKTADIDSIFSVYGRQSMENLRRVESLVREKAHGREVVIWGRGWLEGEIIQAYNFTQRLAVKFYISRDAPFKQEWRGKPVKTIEEANLSPERHYVLVIAIAAFREIRDNLIAAGFCEYEDFCDIEKLAPIAAEKPGQPQRRQPCPICGGADYTAYNSGRPRRCVKCGSVERHRTMQKVFAEHVSLEQISGKILHISPGAPERRFFKQAGVTNIVTLDVRPQVKADITADICHMPQVASDSFAMVFASCVLNHVYDDEAALSEICRVLRKDGVFVVWVMGSGGMKTTDDKDPTAWYGGETMQAYRVGTYRHYGETDFTAQLKRHFARVKSYDKYDAVTETSCCWYVCEK